MNIAIVLGNVGNDPKSHTTESGRTVANFSLATEKTFKNKAGEKTKKTTWHRVVVWGKRAETIIQYVKKGQRIAVMGEIEHRKYTDKNGVEKESSEINANDFWFQPSGKGNVTSTSPEAGAAQAVAQSLAKTMVADDLPF